MPALNQHDVNIIQSMAKKQIYPPFQIRPHQKIDGYGGFAYRAIHKNQLICLYSGDVLSFALINKMKYSEAYRIQFIQGVNNASTWLISPQRFCSFGGVFNYKKQSNIKAILCFAKEKLVIVLKAIKQIEIGQ